jgi:DNA-binding winged helix-turn-helix (wHTH) protein/class 3 adenylate cyclase/predicted ATPase
MRYAFDDYTLDPEHYELRQAGRLVRLEPRVFDLLVYLVQHPGRTVTKEELLEQLWPHQCVTDDSLTTAVAQVRRALHDTGQAQRYIQTVRRRGYRFIASIEVLQQVGTDARRPPTADPLMPTEQNALDQVDTGSPPPPVQPVPPSAPPPAPDPVRAPRAAGPATIEAERRQMTVLVCRLVGVAERAEPLDPEELLEVARDYQALCAEAVHRFDGHIAQDQGDRLVAYFGYPQAHEDDARRAVHTGLSLVEGMAEINRLLTRARGVRLAVRVGIHTGVVVVGALSQDERAPLALGETPTIAARVQGLAAPDMVVISSTTLRLVERYFDSRALGAYILEDAAEPLAVSEILQESPILSQFEVMITKGLTPLVGREQEMGLLRERWARVKDGLGQVVLVSGEAGIGKSRLAQGLKEHLTGEAHTRIEYRAWSYYQQSAFYPVVEHMQRLLQWRKDDTPEETLRKLEAALGSYDFALEEVVPLFAALLWLPLPERYAPLTLVPERQKQKTLEALLTWLLREAERQPVCLIMEDLHWVDPSTLEWLSLLIDQIPTARVLMLLLFRPDFRPPWAVRSHLTHLALGRLSLQQTERMIGNVVEGKLLPAEVVQKLVSTTDGVPLFVEELTKMVVDLGLVKEREERYELTGPLPPLAIPMTLHDSLMARLDRLGSAKQVAQLGAVVGREFGYEVLQAVSPVKEAVLQQGLALLVDAELLYQRGLPPQARYRFKHALIQEAAYQSLLRSTRRQYHQQIVQVLEAQSPETCETHPELVAHHYTEAGLHAQAIPYWQRAGQRAMERSANAEALVHLTKGLALLRTLPDTLARAEQELTLQLALGTTIMILKGHTAPELERIYTRACELGQQVGDGQQRFRALLGLQSVYSNRAELKKAHELGEELLRLAQRMHDPALLLQTHFAQGVTLFSLGEFPSALRHQEQVMGLYDPQKHRSHVSLVGADRGVTSLSHSSWVLWSLGYPDRALRKSQEALALAKRLSHTYTCVYALDFAARLRLLRREAQPALNLAEVEITHAREHGFARFLAVGIALRGWALTQQGAVEEGLTQLRQAAATLQELGGSLRQIDVFAMLAEAYGRGGHIEEGLGILTEALARVHKNGECHYEAELYRLKGELLLQDGKSQGAKGQRQEREDAEECFLQAIDVARQQRAKSLELRAVMSLGRLWQQQDKCTEAHQMLAESYGWFTEGFDTLDLQEAKILLEELA